MNKHKSINSDNTNVQDINNTDNSTHNGIYSYQQHNKTADLRREKQFTEEEKYKPKHFRHLLSIESRIKNDSNQKKDHARLEEDPASTN